MGDLHGKVEHAVRQRRCTFHWNKKGERHHIEPNEPCFTIKSSMSNNTYNLCEKAIEEILNEIEDERILNMQQSQIRNERR